MRSMVELLNRSPADHERNSGRRYSIEKAMPAQGFTAVNGLDPRQPASSSEALMDPSNEPHLRSNANGTSAEPNRMDLQPPRQTTTRNDSVLCPDPAIKLSPETAKRKRLMTDNIEHSHRESPTSAVALSPKRRMTDSRNSFHSHTPSGSTLNLLTTHVSIENTRDRCSRERSPVPTRNQRSAPPQVRPETEQHLAESLATHLQDVSNQTPMNGASTSQPAKPAQPTPATARREESPVDAYSPGADPSDPHSKRKRNFSNRTKTGCHTCRTRKKKCDEAKPECQNCLRGGFTCTGYGPKPIETQKSLNANGRSQVPLQSKIQDAPPLQSPLPLSSDGPRYDHWGRIPPTPTTQEPYHRLPPTVPGSSDIRHPQARDSWRPSWQYREPDSPYGPNNPPPPVDYHQPMPPTSYFESRPPSDSWRHDPYRSHPPGAVSNLISRESVSGHSSRGPPFAPMPSSEVSEKYKMLIGEPYKAHIDGELLDDRRSCKAAVERWNAAHQPGPATSDEEKGRLFKAILDPYQRDDRNYQYREKSASLTRPGSIGSQVIVVSPFTCDYGYNIHIGDDTFIGANCTIEDAADIAIGSRVHIGKNVIFCGTDEPVQREGSQSELTAGAIIVEDEVHIGAGTIIMPHRVIGKGASVAAGSVVTRNIPAYTVAAGNPCRVIKSLPRSDSPEQKRHSRELTAFTTNSGSHGSVLSDEDVVSDKQLMLENERSLRDMRARRGIREQGRR